MLRKARSASTHPRGLAGPFPQRARRKRRHLQTPPGAAAKQGLRTSLPPAVLAQEEWPPAPSLSRSLVSQAGRGANKKGPERRGSVAIGSERTLPSRHPPPPPTYTTTRETMHDTMLSLEGLGLGSCHRPQSAHQPQRASVGPALPARPPAPRPAGPRMAPKRFTEDNRAPPSLTSVLTTDRGHAPSPRIGPCRRRPSSAVRSIGGSAHAPRFARGGENG